jgi:hypothetical protein
MYQLHLQAFRNKLVLLLCILHIQGWQLVWIGNIVLQMHSRWQE